nr:MAG TPA: hypothetical protein [Caudoviricetes sp.]
MPPFYLARFSRAVYNHPENFSLMNLGYQFCCHHSRTLTVPKSHPHTLLQWRKSGCFSTFLPFFYLLANSF